MIVKVKEDNGNMLVRIEQTAGAALERTFQKDKSTGEWVLLGC